MSQIENDILNTIVLEAGVSAEVLSRATTFYDVGIDSLSSLEILAALEDKYDIILDAQELRDTGTISAIVKVVASKIQEKEMA